MWAPPLLLIGRCMSKHPLMVCLKQDTPQQWLHLLCFACSNQPMVLQRFWDFGIWEPCNGWVSVEWRSWIMPEQPTFVLPSKRNAAVWNCMLIWHASRWSQPRVQGLGGFSRCRIFPMVVDREDVLKEHQKTAFGSSGNTVKVKVADVLLGQRVGRVCAISQQAFARLSTAGKQWMDEGGVPSSGRISMCSVPFLMLFSWKEFWKAKAQQGWGRNFFWSCGVCKQPTISDIIGFRSSRITRVVSQVWQQKGMLWVQQRMEARLKKSWSGGDCRDSERYGIPPLLADWTLCDCEKWIETANMMVAWVPTFRRFADGLIKGDGWWRVEAVQTVQRREIRVKKVWHQHPSFLMWRCHGLVAGLAWCQ